MVRSEIQIPYVRGFGVNFAQQNGKGGDTYPRRMFVAGEAPVARRRISKPSPRLPGAPTILGVLVA
jgi:hypothetical protein